MNALELLEALPVMLWTAQADGVWTHVNARWSAYTGLQDPPGGYGFEAALHPDDVASTVALWTEAVQAHTPYRAEYRLRRADGLYRWHFVQGARVRQPDSEVVWTGACTDIHDQKMAEKEARLTRQSAVRALGLALEARDHETKGHTDRVTSLAVHLGEAVGLHEEALQTLRMGAYLHDIGKIAVPDAILLKPGALDPEERLEMQQHVTSGERFAASLGFLNEAVLEVIRAHHERWDGAGYPVGLNKEQIPLLARIFALADVYDALVSERPYKQAWTREQALREISAQAGRQFDPYLTALFVNTMRPADPGDGKAEPAAISVPDTSGFASISEHVRALALHEAAVSVLITDAEQRLVYVNPAFSRITGYGPEEVIGRNPRFLQGPGTDPDAKQALREAIEAQRPIHQLILNYDRSGQELWFDMHLTPIFLRGRLAYYVAVQSDSSAEVADHRRLQWSARHDALTGLPNRFSLNQTLAGLTTPSALIFLDVDNLKGINDRYGHLVGDRVLQGVADTLRAHAPPGSQAFRLGGDEFLMLLPANHEEEALRCVATLRQALAGVETGDGQLTGSFGVAYFPQEGQDLWLLMGLADERMYQEKLGHANRRASAGVRNAGAREPNR